MQSKSLRYASMLEDHANLWVNNETTRMYIKENDEWRRLPRVYHPAHNVHCDDPAEPGATPPSSERDWWYDNETGIWWCSVAGGWQVAKQSCIPSSKLPNPTWTSPEHVAYTAVLYNTIQHYRLHSGCDDETIPACIQLERTCAPDPSYEHPTSLLAYNGAWVPDRRVYFGVPEYTGSPDQDAPRRRRCSRCWWYLSSVSVGDLEESYRMELRHADKTQRVAFGPLHLDTILGMHVGYPIDDIWIAPSDGTTPPPYHQFQYTLFDCKDLDDGRF